MKLVSIKEGFSHHFSICLVIFFLQMPFFLSAQIVDNGTLPQTMINHTWQDYSAVIPYTGLDFPMNSEGILDLSDVTFESDGIIHEGFLEPSQGNMYIIHTWNDQTITLNHYIATSDFLSKLWIETVYDSGYSSTTSDAELVLQFPIDIENTTEYIILPEFITPSGTYYDVIIKHDLVTSGPQNSIQFHKWEFYDSNNVMRKLLYADNYNTGTIEIKLYDFLPFGDDEYNYDESLFELDIDGEIIYENDLFGGDAVNNTDLAEKSGLTKPLVQKNNLFKISPNPFAEEISLSFSEFEASESFIIQIFNINGSIVDERMVQQQVETINLSHYESGVYIVKLLNDGIEIDLQKIIKQ